MILKTTKTPLIGDKTVITRQTEFAYFVEVWQGNQKIYEYFRFKEEEALLWHEQVVAGFLSGSRLSLAVICSKCSKLRQLVFDGSARFQLCPHCNADADGKVHPRKRESPRTIEKFDLQPNEELDSVISKILAENQKAVDDYKLGNKAAINRLVGLTKKQLPLCNANEIKQRLEALL